MTLVESFILGLIQGLTEFLPVSSSGHLEIGKAILGLDHEESLTFTVVVHGATVLSTIIVFWKQLRDIIAEFFKLSWNDAKVYVLKITISMIPIAIVGVFFKEQVESLFSGNLVFVGSMLIVTAVLLGFSNYAVNRERNIGYLDSFIIGIAQALAVLPGISRSGATISTGLLLGNKKGDVAQFSFLMVLIPIVGANVVDLKDMQTETSGNIEFMPLLVGFSAAFLSGLLACKLMISIVKRSKLIYFAGYCLIIGTVAILLG